MPRATATTSYLAGIGASGALLATTVAAFLFIGALVSLSAFPKLPGIGGDDAASRIGVAEETSSQLAARTLGSATARGSDREADLVAVSTPGSPGGTGGGGGLTTPGGSVPGGSPGGGGTTTGGGGTTTGGGGTTTGGGGTTTGLEPLIDDTVNGVDDTVTGLNTTVSNTLNGLNTTLNNTLNGLLGK